MEDQLEELERQIENEIASTSSFYANKSHNNTHNKIISHSVPAKKAWEPVGVVRPLSSSSPSNHMNESDTDMFSLSSLSSHSLSSLPDYDEVENTVTRFGGMPNEFQVTNEKGTRAFLELSFIFLLQLEMFRFLHPLLSNLASPQSGKELWMIH